MAEMAELVPIRDLDDLPTTTAPKRLVWAREHWDEIRDEPIIVLTASPGHRRRSVVDGNHRVTIARERMEPLWVRYVDRWPPA